jgi:hypothetical protein
MERQRERLKPFVYRDEEATSVAVVLEAITRSSAWCTMIMSPVYLERRAPFLTLNAIDNHACRVFSTATFRLDRRIIDP